MAYQAPHVRNRRAVAQPVEPPKVDMTSVAEFPTLGHVPVPMARTINETSLAVRAAAWNEASRPKVVLDSRKCEKALEDAKIALRGFYKVSMAARTPTPYRYQHEIEQDRLDELEAMEAYDADDDIPGTMAEDQWTSVVRPSAQKGLTGRPKSPPREEVDSERIRERITFLTKKLRRNDLQNQNSLTRQAYEKELRELYQKLKHDESD